MRWSRIDKTRLILVLALLFTTLAAGVFRTPPILFLAATLCGAPLIGVGVGRFASQRLRITRQMPPSGTVGDVIRVRFTVSNAGWCPALLVHVRSLYFEAPSPRSKGPRNESPPDLTAALEPLQPGAFSEDAGENVVVGNEESGAEWVHPIVWGHSEFSGEIAWKLKRRGEYQVPGAGAGAFDPVGVFASFKARSATQTFVVLPRPLKLQRLEMLSGTSGSARPRGSASVADAAEMNGVRPHRPGEGMRRIHWKATARSNVLHVVEWEEETASAITVLIDTQAGAIAGPTGADSLESSIVVAASVAAYALENGQRATLFWWEKDALGARHLVRFEGRHRGALAALLTALARLRPCEHPEATLAALVREAGRHSPDEGMLILGSDRCDWEGAWRVALVGGFRCGLAFDSASFEATEAPTASKGHAAGNHWPRTRGKAVAAAQNSVARGAVNSLPRGVRRVRRLDALAAVLERGD